MKASELMINDLIYVYGRNNNLSSKPHWYVRKVTADWLVAMERGEANDKKLKDYGVVIPEQPPFTGDSKPIPLTEELLKANGFEILYSGAALLVQYDGYVILTKDHGDSRYQFAGYGHYSIYITYVHEFQHALRLCGLSHLANNLKIMM